MQYIKIAKELKKDLSPRELILYGMIAAYLSIPGFEATHGGFKKFLEKHTSNGSHSFNLAWHSLRKKGYLKMVRIPFAKSKFNFYYELYPVARQDIPSKRTLSREDGEEYIKNKRHLYTAPTAGYCVISRNVLLNSALSFEDKWLWLVIKQQLDLFKNNCLKESDGTAKKYLVKEDMFLASSLTPTTFNSSWRKLRQAECLIPIRLFDRQYGVTRYEYTLAGNVNVNAIYKAKSDKKATPVCDNGFVKEESVRTYDYIDARRAVCEQIRYADLVEEAKMQHALRGENWLSKNRIDSVLNTMVSVLSGKKQSYSIGGREFPQAEVRERMLMVNSSMVREVLQHIGETQHSGKIIKNFRAYLVASLYNAVTEKATFVASDAKYKRQRFSPMVTAQDRAASFDLGVYENLVWHHRPMIPKCV